MTSCRLGGRCAPRLSGKFGVGLAGRGWRVVSTVSPKYVLVFGNDTLDGFHERQVSLCLGQSSGGTGAGRIQSALALHPLWSGSIRYPSLTISGDTCPAPRDRA